MFLVFQVKNWGWVIFAFKNSLFQSFSKLLHYVKKWQPLGVNGSNVECKYSRRTISSTKILKIQHYQLTKGIQEKSLENSVHKGTSKIV